MSLSGLTRESNLSPRLELRLDSRVDLSGSHHFVNGPVRPGNDMKYMDLYAQNILDRYKKPFYKSLELGAESSEPKKSDPLPAHSSQLIAHKEANHSCGDVVEVKMELHDGKIKEYRFSGAGCAISMAAADMLGDLIMGMTEKEALDITKEVVYEMLGIEISVRRSKCALLGLLVLQNGLLSHQHQALRSWKDYHI